MYVYIPCGVCVTIIFFPYVVLPGTVPNENGLYTLRIHPGGISGPTGGGLEVASRHLEEIRLWQTSIQEAIVNLDEAQLKLDQQVRKLQIAREMSDIIVYCRSVPFDINSECVTIVNVVLQQNLSTHYPLICTTFLSQ